MINWIKEEQLVRHEDNEYENIMARVCIQTRCAKSSIFARIVHGNGIFTT